MAKPISPLHDSVNAEKLASAGAAPTEMQFFFVVTGIGVGVLF